MVEGAALSSYATGESPNTHGVCSPAPRRCAGRKHGPGSRLNGVLIDKYGQGENAGYPSLCKGASTHEGATYQYALEEPTSLNTWSCCRNR